MAVAAPRTPANVIVVRYAHVGDIVLTTSALDALKTAWPQARIHYALNAGFGDLVRHHPAVASVVERGKDEGDFAFARRLRGLAPDALLDLQGFARNALVRPLSGAKQRVVFKRRPFADQVAVAWLGVRRYRSRMTISERYHRAAEKLVGRTLPHGEMRHHLGPDDEPDARAALAAAGADLAKPLVGMAPGSNFETKRWPLDRWAALAARLEKAGFQVVITGSTAEAPLAGPVRALCPSAADLTGKLTLGSLAGTISLCRAFAANDSGPMHIARALGVPTLAFFGSTDPTQFSFEGHGLMWAGSDCAPCSLWGLPKCPQGHFRCMNDLDVDRAWTTLGNLTGGAGPRVGLVHG